MISGHAHCQQTSGKQADMCGSIQYDILAELKHISLDIQKQNNKCSEKTCIDTGL